MAPTGRRKDFIALEAQNDQRIRALETGAHPVSANVEFYASVALTNLAKRVGAPGNLIAPAAGTLQWRKRSGIASLRGEIQIADPAVMDPAGDWFADLPDNARPTVAMRFNVVSSAGGLGRVEVHPDGKVVLFQGSLPAHPGAGTVTIYVDGINWPVA